MARFPTRLRDRAGWATFLEAKRPADPVVHQIEPTNRCPYTCVMCPRTDHMTRPLGDMDLGLYRRIVDEMATFSEDVRAADLELFHFGESLLHPDIARMTAEAAERGLRPVLSVNPPSLKPAQIDPLLEARPAKIIMSMDGYDAASNRAIRGRAADFERSLRHVERLAERHRALGSATELVVRIIEMESNRAQLDAAEAFWNARGLRVERRDFFPWSLRDFADLGRFEKNPPGMPCPFPWRYLVVQWNGDVVPCCRDYDAVNVMGNVGEATLREIWNGERFREFRARHREGRLKGNAICEECDGLYFTES